MRHSARAPRGGVEPPTWRARCAPVRLKTRELAGLGFQPGSATQLVRSLGVPVEGPGTARDTMRRRGGRRPHLSDGTSATGLSQRQPQRALGYSGPASWRRRSGCRGRRLSACPSTS
eukprot:scaffold1156_cov394-Prasinococcus_capsulatus_cf.AAC.13